MAKSSETKTNKVKTRTRTPLSVEARENKIIAMVMDLAEQQIADGTVSAQVMTHFLKLGTEKYKLERAKLENETKLLDAKTEAINSGRDIKELYDNALTAMRSYSGAYDDDEDEDIF